MSLESDAPLGTMENPYRIEGIVGTPHATAAEGGGWAIRAVVAGERSPKGGLRVEFTVAAGEVALLVWPDTDGNGPMYANVGGDSSIIPRSPQRTA